MVTIKVRREEAEAGIEDQEEEDMPQAPVAWELTQADPLKGMYESLHLLRRRLRMTSGASQGSVEVPSVTVSQLDKRDLLLPVPGNRHGTQLHLGGTLLQKQPGVRPRRRHHGCPVTHAVVLKMLNMARRQNSLLQCKAQVQRCS